MNGQGWVGGVEVMRVVVLIQRRSSGWVDEQLVTVWVTEKGVHGGVG